MTEPTVTKVAIFDMQVCVPKEYTDKQVEEFANRTEPAGTRRGWRIRDASDPKQRGAPTRVTCSEHAENVHIMLSC